MKKLPTPRNEDEVWSFRSSATLYDISDRVLVRAPLLPVETYLSLRARPIATSSDQPQAARSRESDAPQRHDAPIDRALAVGSGDLFEALERSPAQAGDGSVLGGKLLRYMIRMSTRPTPYGLFAGVALAQWGSRTDLALAATGPRTRMRPDMEWLLGLVFSLESQREIRKHLCFTANSAAFVHQGRVLLLDRAPGDKMVLDARVSVRATEAVNRTLALAETPIAYEELLSQLMSIPGATVEKVEGLITSLWEQTLLLTDLRPPLTVASPARYVAERLDGIPAAEEARRLLDGVLDEMATWDALPVEQGLAAYRDLVKLTRSAYVDSPNTTIQVDMALDLAGCQISDAVAGEAVRAAELLLRLTPGAGGLAHIDAYRQAFMHRYGPDREVGLLELLHPDSGLGPPAAWSQGVMPVGVEPHRHLLRQETLRDLALDAIRAHRAVVQLDDETLARLSNWSPDPATAPTSLDISLFVLADTAAAIDAGEFQIVVGPNLGATAAGRSLGRFAELLGPEAEATLRRAARAERAHAPAALWIEVSYLPRHLRSANVAIRPMVRDREIAIGTSSSGHQALAASLRELVVGVRDRRFYVRWPQEDVDVIGCAGHMLNTFRAPVACRFLDEVRQDRVAQFSGFDWGPAADFPFLPRVERGRVILSPAQWRLDNGLPTHSLDEFARAVQRWRADWDVPQYVYLSVGDNRLLLNLDDEAHVQELYAEARLARNRSRLILCEALPLPRQAWTSGPDGQYLIELVVPLLLRGAETRNGSAGATRRIASPVPPVSTRLRPPGTDWLFAKLYLERDVADELIAGSMASFCEYAISCGLAQDWFFVRYADPDPHLRLRFRGAPDRLVEDLIPQLSSWAAGLIANGLCLRFCLDTYDREVNRYGGARGTTAAEALFAADSYATAGLLKLAQRPGLAIDLTNLAVLNVDDLLTGLKFDASQRLDWYRAQPISKRESGPEYRQRKESLRSMLADPSNLSAGSGGADAAQIFATRRQALAAIRDDLDALDTAGQLEDRISSLCASFVHMSCNRLLGADWPSEERILGLLLRTFTALDRAPIRHPAQFSSPHPEVVKPRRPHKARSPWAYP